MGPAGFKFIKELGRMTCEKTMEKRPSSFIMQSITMEVLRSNVACITATVDSPTGRGTVPLFGTKGQRDKLKILPRAGTGRDSQDSERYGTGCGTKWDRAEKDVLKHDVLKQKTMF